MYGNIGNSSVLEQHCHSLVASSWRKVVYFPEKTSGNKKSCIKTTFGSNSWYNNSLTQGSMIVDFV